MESEQEQRQRLEERIARRKQLIADREAQGLPTDDNTIDNIIEEEEAEQQRIRRRVKWEKAIEYRWRCFSSLVEKVLHNDSVTEKILMSLI